MKVMVMVEVVLRMAKEVFQYSSSREILWRL